MHVPVIETGIMNSNSEMSSVARLVCVCVSRGGLCVKEGWVLGFFLLVLLYISLCYLLFGVEVGVACVVLYVFFNS